MLIDTQLKLDGAVADIMELCLYNAVLTSMSHDGKRFTYVNQLASSNEDPSRRENWFTCACCPPNMLRFLGQIGGYIWSHKHDKQTDVLDVIVHLYIPGTLSFDLEGEEVELQQDSNWPWDGCIDFKLTTKLRNLRVKLRIPGWAPFFEVLRYTVLRCAIANPFWTALQPRFEGCCDRWLSPVRQRVDQFQSILHAHHTDAASTGRRAPAHQSVYPNAHSWAYRVLR